MKLTLAEKENLCREIARLGESLAVTSGELMQLVPALWSDDGASAKKLALSVARRLVFIQREAGKLHVELAEK